MTICLTGSGCFSLDITPTDRDGEQHLLVANYGWYFLNLFPIACGNAAEDRFLPFVLFRDDVTMDKIQHRFMTEAERFGENVGELTWNVNESVLFTIPGLGFDIPLPYIFCYREKQLSGVVR